MVIRVNLAFLAGSGPDFAFSSERFNSVSINYFEFDINTHCSSSNNVTISLRDNLHGISEWTCIIRFLAENDCIFGGGFWCSKDIVGNFQPNFHPITSRSVKVGHHDSYVIQNDPIFFLLYGLLKLWTWLTRPRWVFSKKWGMNHYLSSG